MAGKGDARFKITADDSDIQRKIKTVRTNLNSLGKVAIGGAALAGVAALAGGMVALNRVVQDSIKLAGVQEAAEAKLGAVLKATGEAAGYNLQQMKDMASALQQVTTVGDETIIAGQAILATFKKIQGEAFERTTKVALDMSAVFGTTLKSSMVQLGKAINDPVQGMSMLTRVGITFTDAEKKKIRVLQESGKLYEAQAVMLDKLEGKFRGAAEALRGTFHGALEATNNAYGDLKEELGFVITKNEFFIEIVKMAEEAVIGLTGDLQGNAEANRELAKSISIDLVAGFGNVLKVMRFFELAWEGLELVANLAIVGIATGLEKLTTAFKTFLFGFDKAFDAAVWAGILDNNPLEEMAGFMTDFKMSAIDGFNEVENKISGTIEFYDNVDDKVQGIIATMETLGTDGKKSLEELAEGEKKVAEGAEEMATAIDVAAVELDDHFTSLRAYNINVAKAVQETVPHIEASNEKIKHSNEDVTVHGVQLWEDFASETGNIIHSFVSDTVHGEFESIGDMFSGLLDSMLDMLLNFISKAAANSIINALFPGGAGAGALTLGSLFGGAGGGSGGLGLAGGLGAIGSKISGFFGGGSAIGAAGSGTAGAWMGGGAAAGLGSGGSAALGSGTSTAWMGGGAAAGLGGALSMGAFVAPIILGFADAMMSEKPKLEQILNENMINPLNLAAAGIGEGFESVSGKLDETLAPALEKFDAASYDAANGVLVLGQNIGGASAATDELSHMTATQIQLFDAATGTWQASGVSMQSLVAEVQALQPAGHAAVTATAELVAAQHGLSSIAGELESSYYAQGNAMKALAGVSSMAASAFEAAGGRVAAIRWDTVGSDNQYAAQRAIASYASGTDYVPKTGLYQLHQGEKVTPASGNTSGSQVIENHITITLDGKVIDARVDRQIVRRETRGITGRAVL